MRRFGPAAWFAAAFVAACLPAPASGQAGGLEGMNLSPSKDPQLSVPIWTLTPFDRFCVGDPSKNGTWLDIEPQRLPEDFDYKTVAQNQSKEWVVQQFGLPTTLTFPREKEKENKKEKEYYFFRFRLLADSGRYEVRSDGIGKIETYEEVIFEALKQELEKDTNPDRVKFDDCLEYLRILKEREKELDSLEKLRRLKNPIKFARVRFHAAEANAALAKAEYPRSFECFEAERRARLLIPADANPDVAVASLAPLDERAARMCHDWLKLVVGGSRYDEGRRIVARLEATFPGARAGNLGVVADEWRRTYHKLAVALVERARQNVEAGFVPKAYDLLDEAVAIQPDHPEVRAAFRKLYETHARLRVAVAELPAFRQGPAAWTPADQRAVALLHEPMVRLSGYKPDGSATFASRLLSTIKDEDNLNRKVSIEVAAGLAWPGDAKPVTPVDVQRQFALARDPQAALHHPALELLLTNVQARPPAATLLEFDRPQFQARMWLQTPLFRIGADPTANNSVAGLGWQGLGPFRAYDRSLTRVQYVGNPRYVAPGQPAAKQLNEVRIVRPEDRFRALEYGYVDAVEFVPWRYTQHAAKTPGARVVREGAPKVHLLQFNFSRDLLRNAQVRRAIALGLDRPAIFKAVQLEAGKQDAILANAAPLGALGNDPAAKPWPFESVLAKVLLATAKREMSLAVAPLSIAFQGNESTRVAVQEIAKQLKAIGFEVTIQQVDDRNPDPRTADMRYQVFVPTEPVYDLVTLLTRDNPSLFANASPRMRTLLVELLQVSSSTKALALMPTIHQAVKEDVALVPLWQWHDQFLISDGVEGVPAQPKSLYDGVSAWKAEPRFPPSWWETKAPAGAKP